MKDGSLFVEVGRRPRYESLITVFSLEERVRAWRGRDPLEGGIESRSTSSPSAWTPIWPQLLAVRCLHVSSVHSGPSTLFEEAWEAEINQITQITFRSPQKRHHYCIIGMGASKYGKWPYKLALVWFSFWSLDASWSAVNQSGLVISIWTLPLRCVRILE